MDLRSPPLTRARARFWMAALLLGWAVVIWGVAHLTAAPTLRLSLTSARPVMLEAYVGESDTATDICWTVEGLNYYGRSCSPTRRSPIERKTFTWVPGGEYVAGVAIAWRDGTVGRAETRFFVPAGRE